jgi:hypothetical protein
MGKVCPGAEWLTIHSGDGDPGGLIIILDDEGITAVRIVLPSRLPL